MRLSLKLGLVLMLLVLGYFLISAPSCCRSGASSYFLISLYGSLNRKLSLMLAAAVLYLGAYSLVRFVLLLHTAALLGTLFQLLVALAGLGVNLITGHIKGSGRLGASRDRAPREPVRGTAGRGTGSLRSA